VFEYKTGKGGQLLRETRVSQGGAEALIAVGETGGQLCEARVQRWPRKSQETRGKPGGRTVGGPEPQLPHGNARRRGEQQVTIFWAATVAMLPTPKTPSCPDAASHNGTKSQCTSTIPDVIMIRS